MKRSSQISLVAVLLSVLVFAGSAPAASASNMKILQFSTMVGLPPSLTSAKSNIPLRGMNGGGLPWMIGSATGSLTASGRLKVEVEGLVLAAGTSAGSNPVPAFRAVVSCVTSNGSFDNIETDAFPATTGPATAGGGDADIETTVSLPQPCIAPIIFVTSPSEAWFAATGF